MKIKSLFLSFILVALMTGVSWGGISTDSGMMKDPFWGVYTNSNCDQTQYYPIGILCQDTDDGKLYKGTGSAIEEIAGGTGDVTGVGDCASGACFDGTSDGGTYIRLYDGTSAYESITGGVRLFTFASSTASSENLVLTLGANDNTITLTSGTGANSIIADSFTIRSNGLTADTAGGATVGSAALPFSSVYIGDAATNNIQLTGTAASAVVVTLPSVTSTLATLTSPAFVTSILPSAAGATAIGTTALPFSSIFIGDAATTNVQLINTAAASAVVLTLPSTTGTLALAAETLPIGGGTLTGNLLFTDNTYDIGASGATRPRTGYFGTSVVSPFFISTAADGVRFWNSSNTNDSSTTGEGDCWNNLTEDVISCYHAGAIARYVREGKATGGLIFGDSSPDAAGEIGYDGALKYYDAVGSKTVATLTGTETLTNKTLTAPAITAGEVLYASTWLVSEAAYTFTAAEVSRTIINTYGRDAACDPTLPTAAAGYTFIVVVGTQHNSKFEILKGASTLYWEVAGVPTAVAGFNETNQVVGSRASCASFKTGASAWSWLCGAVSGTWSYTAL